MVVHEGILEHQLEEGFSVLLVLCFIFIWVITGVRIADAPMRTVVHAIKQLTPIPDTFRKAWATHHYRVETSLLKCLKSVLLESVNKTFDEKTAEHKWNYLKEHIFTLENCEGYSIWDEEVAASYAFSHDIMDFVLESQATFNSLPVNTKMFTCICTRIFGNCDVDYDKIFTAATRLPRRYTSDPELIGDDYTGIELKAFDINPIVIGGNDTIITTQQNNFTDIKLCERDQLHHALKLVRSEYLKIATLHESQVPRFALVKWIAQSASLVYEAECQRVVEEIVTGDGVGNVKAVDGPWLTQDVVARLSGFFDSIMPINSQLNGVTRRPKSDDSNFCKIVDELVFPELLRSVAFVLKQEFNDILLEIATKADLDQHALHMAPIKGTDRMRVTLENYRARGMLTWPYSAYFGDVLRCSYSCSDGKVMRRIYEEIHNDPRIDVVQMSNKASTGRVPYNLHISALLKSNQFDYPFIVEIQILHEWIYEMKDRSHRLYEVTRAPKPSDI
eukprot:CAMPEP_0185794750 /NCGR_PEP_ID=MMETSP1174-20130828/160177_1 /TAXON_ID=35687 /ORGANISM="Dictyocha speculum, Strain CCMP1381" /LENGTH=503 /DNA_ID=CAMNT_0028489995 /DNA_START=1233 /DNA_END=2744 /DNA_ORIENTATION=+